MVFQSMSSLPSKWCRPSRLPLLSRGPTLCPSIPLMAPTRQLLSLRNRVLFRLSHSFYSMSQSLSSVQLLSDITGKIGFYSLMDLSTILESKVFDVSNYLASFNEDSLRMTSLNDEGLLTLIRYRNIHKWRSVSNRNDNTINKQYNLLISASDEIVQVSLFSEIMPRTNANKPYSLVTHLDETKIAPKPVFVSLNSYMLYWLILHWYIHAFIHAIFIHSYMLYWYIHTCSLFEYFSLSCTAW